MNKICLLILAGIMMMPQSFADDFIKKPNVSGQFYPGTAGEINAFMDEAFGRVGKVPEDKEVELLISPHAGYVFSGWVAAYGFKAVSNRKYSTVILIGPSHFH